MKNKDTLLRTKLIISVVLLFLVVSFLALKPNAGENKTQSYENNNSTIIEKNKLTIQEQQKYLEHLSLAGSCKLECENGYRNIETGSVIEDNTEYGKGARVVHCISGSDKPGYAVRNLIIAGGEQNVKNKLFNDTMHTLYIRPRLRIKKELIYPVIENYNDRNLFTPVCRLEIVNTDGKIVKEVEYEAMHFLEKHPDDQCRIYYSGNYHEGFGNYLSFDSVISIEGKEINPKGMLSVEKTKLDFRIYWYGYTDIWIDFIEVENDITRELLSGRYDMVLNAMDNVNQKVLEEITTASYPKICYDYIVNRIGKKEYSLK